MVVLKPLINLISFFELDLQNSPHFDRAHCRPGTTFASPDPLLKVLMHRVDERSDIVKHRNLRYEDKIHVRIILVQKQPIKEVRN